MESEIAEMLKELRLNLQFIRRRANDLRGEFEVCDDINLAVIAALKTLAMLETNVLVADREIVAA